MKTALFLFLLGFVPAFGASGNQILLFNEKSIGSASSEKTALTFRKIIVSSQSVSSSQEELSQDEEVVLRDIQVPGSPERLQKELSGFIGEPLTKDALDCLRQTIREYYEWEYHPLVEVIIPKQEVTDGVVHVTVIESRVDQIHVEGNKYTSPCLLMNYLGLEKEETIDVQEMRKSVDFMNQNPFRRVNLVYSPGKEAGTTDISLLVDERSPMRFYAGTDDTGVETTGRGRAFAGLNCSKVFGLDHFLSLQYTTSYNGSSLQAITGQYTAYLPWKQALTLYGGYSQVDVNLSFPGAKSRGESAQASARYQIPLNPIKTYFQSVSFGFDFKRTNNTVEFSELFPIIANPVNLSQFVGCYEGSYQGRNLRIDGDVKLFWSPGELLPQESNAAYAALRPGATNKWVYGQMSLKILQNFRYAEVFLSGRGQLSSQNLLPSEQVGLGGYSSVRGYDERQLNYDSGVIFNGEVRTLPLSISRKGQKLEKGVFQLLGFIDYGYGGNHTPIPGEQKRGHLLGIGPGARYTLNPWLTARLDLGFKLVKEPDFTGGSAMWHFGIIANL